MKLDLEERTIKFGKAIVKFSYNTEKHQVINKIIDQLVRSGTSIGANYMEAINASSKKDFKNKIFICKKEAQETRYWLIILEDYVKNTELIYLKQECYELNLIFQKIVSTMNAKIKTDN